MSLDTLACADVMLHLLFDGNIMYYHVLICIDYVCIDDNTLMLTLGLGPWWHLMACSGMKMI